MELTKEEREELLQDLNNLRDELNALLGTAEEGAEKVDLDLPIGRLSRVDALQQQSMAKATLANLRVRLAAVEQALSDPDEFGLCRVCGDDIGYKRLKARPEASLCLDCQEERETS